MMEPNGNSPPAQSQGVTTNSTLESELNRPDAQEVLTGHEGPSDSGSEKDYESGTSHRTRKIFTCIYAFIFSGCLFVLQIFPLTALVIGAIYKNDCPAEPFIPIWGIVHGSLGMISTFMQLSILLIKETQFKWRVLFVDVIFIIQFLWFLLAGGYIYRPFENIDHADCNHTVYLFTFWYLTAFFVLIFMLTVLCICNMKKIPNIMKYQMARRWQRQTGRII